MDKKGDLYYPTEEFKKKAWIKDDKIYAEAAKDPVRFWEKLAEELGISIEDINKALGARMARTPLNPKDNVIPGKTLVWTEDKVAVVENVERSGGKNIFCGNSSFFDLPARKSYARDAYKAVVHQKIKRFIGLLESNKIKVPRNSPQKSHNKN